MLSSWQLLWLQCYGAKSDCYDPSCWYADHNYDGALHFFLLIVCDIPWRPLQYWFLTTKSDGSIWASQYQTNGVVRICAARLHLCSRSCTRIHLHTCCDGFLEAGWIVCFFFQFLRPYIKSFKRTLTKKDKRRIQKNKAIKEYQMVKRTINKSTGKKQV